MKSFGQFVEQQTNNIRAPWTDWAPEKPSDTPTGSWHPQSQDSSQSFERDPSEVGKQALDFYNDPNRETYPSSIRFSDPEVGKDHEALKQMQAQLVGIFQRVWQKFQQTRPQDAENLKRDITDAHDKLTRVMLHITDPPPENDGGMPENGRENSNLSVTRPGGKVPA